MPEPPGNTLIGGSPSSAFPRIRRACYERLALALFVFGVFADHGNPSATTDNLAFFTDLFNRCTHFHDELKSFFLIGGNVNF